jgi:predicted metal-binding membrane protein
MLIVERGLWRINSTRKTHVLAGLLLITALAWWWVAIGSGTGMSAYSMTTWRFPPPLYVASFDNWSPSYALVMFFMWWIMMIAMMIPSATPIILLYGHVYRHEQRQGKLPAGAVPTLIFVLGYLFSWAIQCGRHRAAMGSGARCPHSSDDDVEHQSHLYRRTANSSRPLKTACLEHCRSPAQYLAQHFRPGAAGAFRLGCRHGVYCLGCCWFLMALLFAGGIMSLVWIAGLAVYVLIEKVAPYGQLIARLAGAVMVLVGLWVAAGPMLPE